SIVTESTDAAGWASIEVHSSVPGSVVSINQVAASYNSFSNGYIPPGGGYTTGIDAGGVSYSIYQNTALSPGGYIIGVSAPGYYKREIALVLSEKTKYTFYFTLAMISGTLDLSVAPEDAAVSVDGRAVAPGALTLPVGEHTLELRRFGYTDRRIPVVVREKERTRLSVALEPAAFSVSRLVASRTAFNPANAGLFGLVDLRFRVESFGSATLRIEDEKGEVVTRTTFAAFDTWRQVYRWDGRGADGRPLPDGTYRAILEATAAPPPAAGSAAGVMAAPIVRETTLRIDSALVIRPRGSLSAIPGLSLFPDPRGQPGGLSSTDFTWIGPLAAMQSPSFALSGVGALSDRLDIGYAAALEDLSSPSGGGDLALSFRLGLWENSAALPSAGALFLRGSWSSASAPLLPDAASAVEVSLPLSVGLGPFSLGAAPGLRLGFSSSSVEPYFILRNGLWWSASAFRVGLSSEMGLGWANGTLAPAWPLGLGFEVRALLPPSPLEVSALALSQLSPSASPAFDVGLSLGLLF
ncbi:MAG: PEGA domain-containing protein, partial [Treponema sp.]|nr:PEGA domain-containing protein [Treponema sp.]